jgi:hypothetical protein
MFYLRRTNIIGNIFFLCLGAEWRMQWNTGIGGYKVHTFKTQKGAARRADEIAKAHPGQTVSVLTDEGYPGRVVETFGYPTKARA